MHLSSRTPDASVVVGAYEGIDQLPATMDSILTQTGPSFELIVVNDGSGPESSAWLRDLASRDRRVRLIEQGNAGLTAALIRGCREARAPIIIRQDVGDWSAPGRFEALLEAINASTSIVMASSWVRYRGPRGEPLVTVRRGVDPEENRRRLLEHREGPPCHGATAFRRTAFEQAGGYRAKFRYAQDSDLWLRLAELGGFACVQRVLYEWTFELGGISATRQALQAAFGDYAHACRAARLAGVDDPPPPRVTSQSPGPGQRRKARAAALYFVGACLVERGDPRGRGYLARAVRTQPWRARAWARWLGSLVSLTGRADEEPEERTT